MEKNNILTAVLRSCPAAAMTAVLLLSSPARAQQLGAWEQVTVSTPSFKWFDTISSPFRKGYGVFKSTEPGPSAPKSNKDRDLKELVAEVEPEKPGSTVKSLAVYKGDSAINTTYKLNLAAGAHWRVLWKFDAADKKESGKFKMEIKAAADATYLQGITKDIVPAEDSAFGVMNICLYDGGEFTLALSVSHAKWRVEVQQLIDNKSK